MHGRRAGDTHSCAHGTLLTWKREREKESACVIEIEGKRECPKTIIKLTAKEDFWPRKELKFIKFDSIFLFQHYILLSKNSQNKIKMIYIAKNPDFVSNNTTLGRLNTEKNTRKKVGLPHKHFLKNCHTLKRSCHLWGVGSGWLCRCVCVCGNDSLGLLSPFHAIHGLLWKMLSRRDLLPPETDAAPRRSFFRSLAHKRKKTSFGHGRQSLTSSEGIIFYNLCFQSWLGEKNLMCPLKSFNPIKIVRSLIQFFTFHALNLMTIALVKLNFPLVWILSENSSGNKINVERWLLRC